MSDRDRRRIRRRERRRGSRRSDTPSPEAGFRREMREMLERLRALEERIASPSARRRSRSCDKRAPRAHDVRQERSCTPPLPPPLPPPRPPPFRASFTGVPQLLPSPSASCPGGESSLSGAGATCADAGPLQLDPVGAGASEAGTSSAQRASTTDQIVEAIRSINSTQSTGKLDSGMRGPYRVLRVLPHGRYELQLLAGSYGKTTQAAAEYMIPWRGEWTPEVCAAYFEDADSEDEGSTSATNKLPLAQPRAAAGSQSTAIDAPLDAVTTLPAAESSSVPDVLLPPVDPPSPPGGPLSSSTTDLIAVSRPAACIRPPDTELRKSEAEIGEPEDGLLSGKAVLTRSRRQRGRPSRRGRVV